MKVLLDENMPHDLRRLLPGHEVFTVAFMGWSSLENGSLLSAASEKQFDVLLTLDIGMSYSNDVAKLAIAVLLVRTKKNDLAHLEPMIPQILRALKTISPKTFMQIPEE